MLSKLKAALTIFIFLTFPIMSLVDITEGLFMNISLADVAVPFLGLAWLADIRRFSLKRHFPYWWYFFLYLAVLAASHAYNTRTATAAAGVGGLAAEAVKMATNGVFFFVAYNALGEEAKNIKPVLLSWVGGLHIFIAYGLYANISQVAGGTPWAFNRVLSNHYRFLGTLTDANAAALYLSVSFFVVILAKKYFFASFKLRIWLNAVNALVLVCLLLTLSRGGLIGFLFALLVWAALNYKTALRHAYAAPLVLFLLLSVCAVDMTRFSGDILRQAYRRVVDIDTSLEGGMLHTRYHLSLAALRMGADHPLIGIGRGNFSLNSLPYLEEQGADVEGRITTFRGMVPHNTLAGVFAEMGVLGLGAFVSLFIVMLVKVLRQRQADFAYKTIFVALWAGVLVQSLSISLENARVLWLTAGLFLGLADKGIAFEEMQAAPWTGYRKAVGMAAGGFALCAVLYMYVGFRFSDGAVDISGAKQEWPYVAATGGAHTLRYWVRSTAGADEPLPMTVAVRKADTGEVVSAAQYQANAVGQANLYFNAAPAEAFVITFDALEGRAASYVNDVKIHTPGQEWEVLAGRYPLLPEGLYAFAAQRGLLRSFTADTRVKRDALTEGLMAETAWVTLGDAILYKGMNIAETGDGGTRLEWLFECLREMEEDYYLWVHIYPDDINLLADNRRAAGAVNHDHRPEPGAHTWQAGKDYRHSREVYLPDGQYRVHFGFWLPAEGEKPAARLLATDGGLGIRTGWFEVNLEAEN